MSLSTLIVDDEKRAGVLLKKLLENTGEFASIQCAYSASSALELMKKHSPDLVFLDIKMPDQDGFDFLKSLHDGKLNAEIVFVTAYNQFALKALKNHAFDYLMKPVVQEELKECIKSFKARSEKTEVTSRLHRFLEDYEASRKIRFNTRTGFFQVDPRNIVYCLADGNYTHINTGDRDQLCTLNLSAVQELLPRNGFLRPGRSIIINSNYICKVDRKTHEIAFEKGGSHFSINLSLRQIRELDKLI